MSGIPHVHRILLLAVAFIALMATASWADEPVHHAMVRFWIETPADQVWMDQNHLRFQEEGGIGGRYYDFLVKPKDLPEVLAAGSRVEVLHEDVESFWASRIGGSDRDLWGAYHTYSECLAWIDSLHMMYPDVVGERWSIGQGHDGYDIWVYRLSDNPDMDEEGEPETLIDGLHHANEIMGLELVGMITEHLAEQYYAGDPEIVQLLNENEVYMIPMLNPDGLIYNENTYPGGGASWRKNRRDNGDGSWGVDINRNYDYEWGHDNGSSGNPSDPTYRGPYPESEPEVQAVCAFIDSREFIARQSFHSAGDATLYPWAYTTNDTPDEDIFREMGAAMVMYNGYRVGQPGDPGMYYIVSGASFDWDYGATDRHEKIFGFTNEVGTSQWPPTNQRQAIFEDNLWPAIYLIQMAGQLRAVSWLHDPLPYTAAPGVAYDLTAIPSGYEGALIDPSSVTLHYRVNGGGFVDVPMTETGNPGEYGGTIPAQAQGAVVEYYLSASDLDGHDGTSPRNAPSVLHYFEVGEEFEHPMEADRGWTVGDSADDATTGLWVRIDPVGTDAQPEDDHSPDGTFCWATGQHEAGESIGYNDVDGGQITLFSPVYDMTGAQSVDFAYWRWYSNDQGSAPGEDWWDVYLSNDGGDTWTALEHTQVSSNAWESHSYDLADYYGTAGLVQLKFVASDEGSGSIVEAAVDDFSIAGVFDATGAGETPGSPALHLAQNFPNPFNPKTTIRFQLPEAGKVSLGIYDASGRLVRLIYDERMEAGDHAASWNGRDALGRPVVSGVYFARLSTPTEELSRRMVLLK